MTISFRFYRGKGKIGLPIIGSPIGKKNVRMVVSSLDGRLYPYNIEPSNWHGVPYPVMNTNRRARVIATYNKERRLERYSF